MTDKDILRIAMEQSAVDIGADAGDFLLNENVVVPYDPGEGVKSYYNKPISCNFISYGNNIVVGAADEIRDIVKDYIDGFIFYHCFETPNMRWLNERIEPFGQTVCFMAEYYLPDLKLLKKRECGYELKILEKDDFKDLYKPEWANALCMERKELDVLGIGAYDGGNLIGFAGCSADAKEMWQIGIDVLPKYRRQGVASALTSRLALEILDRDKVPFYCSAWSNIRSARNAVKSGFLPAWAEMTVKDIKKVDEING